jgi:tRNA(fMet)-specific endonuclease VapC
MPGERIALDTNAAIKILNAPSGADFLPPDAEVFLTFPVLGELLFGIQNSTRPEVNAARLDALLGRCSVVGADEGTSRLYATIRFDRKRAGRAIPENDLWIAAVCLQNELILATSDAHFVGIPQLGLLQF